MEAVLIPPLAASISFPLPTSPSILEMVPWGYLPMLVASFSMLAITSASNFYQDVDVTWGDGRGRILRRGQLLTLSLDRYCGSGFQSKEKYLFGRIDMKIKLIGGDSAGTVTAFYMTSDDRGNWNTHDEIDFEFLGNLSGDPYTLHTNVYAKGKGGKEMQFKLWFDPTKHFHNYTILWNPKHVIFMVDGIAIRDFKNMESKGVAFPNLQAMRVRSSLWAAEDWATRGGLVKTDWSKAPFVASFRDFNTDACVPAASAERTKCGPGRDGWWHQELDAAGLAKMRWVQKTHMIYNYCTDVNRFPRGLPLECSEP